MRRRSKKPITWERLVELVSYEPATGIFTWRAPRRTCTPGKLCGTRSERRVKICLDRQQYLAHRLAWFYMTREWPDREIDHRNGKQTDNRWKNLRKATRAQNTANTCIRKDNTSGAKGVWQKPNGSWVAEIRAEKSRIYVGTFRTFEAAAAARKSAENEHHREFVRR